LNWADPSSTSFNSVQAFFFHSSTRFSLVQPAPMLGRSDVTIGLRDRVFSWFTIFHILRLRSDAVSQL